MKAEEVKVENLRVLAEFQHHLEKLGGPAKQGVLFEEILSMQDDILNAFGLPSTPENQKLLYFDDIPTDFELKEGLDRLHLAAQNYLLADTESDIQLLRKAKENKDDAFYILPELRLPTHVYTIFVYENIFLTGRDNIENILINLRKSNQSDLLDALGKVYSGKNEQHHLLVQKLKDAEVAYLDQFLMRNKG